MVRENIVDNNFVLYGDQIGMIKDSLAAHKYTISNIMEHSKKRGDLEHKNIWESFVQDIHELSQLFTKLDEMVAEHKIHAISCHLLSPLNSRMRYLPTSSRIRLTLFCVKKTK